MFAECSYINTDLLARGYSSAQQTFFLSLSLSLSLRFTLRTMRNQVSYHLYIQAITCSEFDEQGYNSLLPSGLKQLRAIHAMNASKHLSHLQRYKRFFVLFHRVFGEGGKNQLFI